MDHENYTIIGPIHMAEDYMRACVHCKIVLMRREQIFLLESCDPDEPDAYVHGGQCLMAFVKECPDETD